MTILSPYSVPKPRNATDKASKPVYERTVSATKGRKTSSRQPSNAFPNYMQVGRIIPIGFWHVMRVISVLCAFSVGIILFIEPGLGLTIFWSVFVPVLPFIFFAAPGLWRNICPMAALNQTPRLFKFTRGLTLPNRLKEYGYVLGIAMFLAILLSRKVLFNTTGWALGLLILGALLTAFIMGTLFKGKSGWCSTLCPLLPVQRLYGQTPYLNLPNSHCQPCVGCTTNCYDFNPAVAYLNDLNDKNRHYAGYRKFFASAFPGVVLAFYTLPAPSLNNLLEINLQFLLYILVSMGSFYLINSFIKVSDHKITTLYAAAAFCTYYWFNIPLMYNFIGSLAGVNLPDTGFWAARLILFSLVALWVIRTYRKEKRFLALAVAAPAVPASPAKTLSSAQPLLIQRVEKLGAPGVTFLPDNHQFAVEAETTLLDVAENNNMPIEAGCRMGMCGADPVAIVAGMENLSPAGDDEKATLERLGLADNTRLACCARVRGEVSVSLKPQTCSTPVGPETKLFEFDPNVKRIVIVGNGIAGVTAADHIRRRHPGCEIHLIAREEHHFYNRMGISRLIYGRSAMQGLYLMPESWYDERHITCWLNTRVRQIDHQARTVTLGTGENLQYDRLILATGSSSTVPPVEGYGLPGSFVLREAADAMKIRAFAQEHNSTRAIVAGGGLLGLEAAYALLKLGLKVTVLERSEGLLRRQLDCQSGQILASYLRALGIEIRLKSEVEAILGEQRVEGIKLKDGITLSSDIILIAAGINPNVELAHLLGLRVNRGVVVDEYMRTSLPGILAAGDVAEQQGKVAGLWANAVSQAETAAVNAIGGNQVCKPPLPATTLKVVGIDLTSIGRIEPNYPEDKVIIFNNEAEYRYGKVVISDNKIVGAILLGFPREVPVITAAIKDGTNVTSYLDKLTAGNWQLIRQPLG